MRAFITGSRAYGKPKLSSDIDLVVQVSTADKALLERLCDKDPKNDAEGIKIVKFGDLNLILVETDAEMAVWKFATDALAIKKEKRGRHVGREEAIEFIRKCKKLLKQPDKRVSD